MIKFLGILAIIIGVILGLFAWNLTKKAADETDFDLW